MLKDLLSESAKQFEKLFPVKEFVDTGAWFAAKEYHLAQISSAFALGEESGIKKAVDCRHNCENCKGKEMIERQNATLQSNLTTPSTNN